MTPTILLDLDNTLLGNDMNSFLPPYFAALGQHLGRLLGDKDLYQITHRAVQAIGAGKEPSKTNLDAFLQEFSRGLGHPLETLTPIFETFYQQEYPRLRQYTRPLAEAAPLVRRLLAAGGRVVIATNPLFPAVAIEQRLLWAGLAGFSFALVTSMDNSHFCKPDPRYYQAILVQLGSRPEETWMVGDDPQNDILPARSIGIKTWWINPAPLGPPPPVVPETDRQGSLADFLAWTEAGGLAIER